MSERIVVLDAIGDTVAAKLRAMLPDGFTLSHATERNARHLAAIIADADYAISGQVAVGGEVLQAANRLKLLHKWGVGVDNLDLDTARRLGIPVARTTGSNAVPVAEFTIGLIIGSLRHVATSHHRLQAGEWHDR
ncbi:MAG: 3-phosphoglycerate dehydrogenase, partial [Actinomycetota bacterium]